MTKTQKKFTTIATSMSVAAGVTFGLAGFAVAMAAFFLVSFPNS